MVRAVGIVRLGLPRGLSEKRGRWIIECQEVLFCDKERRKEKLLRNISDGSEKWTWKK